MEDFIPVILTAAEVPSLLVGVHMRIPFESLGFLVQSLDFELGVDKHQGRRCYTVYYGNLA